MLALIAKTLQEKAADAEKLVLEAKSKKDWTEVFFQQGKATAFLEASIELSKAAIK